MTGVWSSMAAGSTPWYDVAGKVWCAMLWENGRFPCGSIATGPATQELARIKKEAYSYFMEEKSS